MPDFSDEADNNGRTTRPSTGSCQPGKARLRVDLLARRRALPVDVRTAAARRIGSALTRLIRDRRCRTVAAYLPVGTEPGGSDLPTVLQDALGADGELLLPVLRADLDLDWAPYRGAERLRAAGRGLREPTGEPLGITAISRADLVVVPALAVDRVGTRLGRGGGSYDRALARVSPAALTVAVLYDGELVAELPAEPHDQPVRATVTPGLGLRPVPTG